MHDSVVIAGSRRALRRYRQMSVADRGRVIGSGILVAFITHVALQLLEKPSGFWWLIVPVMLAAFALATIGLTTVGSDRVE